MTKFLKTTSAALMLVTVLAFVFVTAPAHSAPATQDNLLKNPGFEFGFYAYQGDGGRSVPNDWEPWWDSAKAAPRYNASSEPSRIQSGGSSASYWDVFTDYEAGFRQVVGGITPGTAFRFEAYGMAWSTTNTSVSTSDTDVFMQIGIDPTGNTNPFEGSVVWSGGANPRDAYQLMAVEATATSDEIVVFLRGRTTFPVTQTDMYWDSTSLVAIGNAPPPADDDDDDDDETPPPSNNSGGGGTIPRGSIPQSTPAPDGSVVHVVRTGETLIGVAVTYDVTLEDIRRLNNLTSDVIFVGQTLVIKTPSGPAPVEAEPEEDAEEEEVAEEEPTEEPVEEEVVEEILPASICVMGYSDANSNGLREAGEATLAGLTFVLSDGINTVATYTTDGVSEPYCFADLEPGQYIISWVGDTLTPTTEQTWQTTIASGDTVSREFGATSPGSGAEDEEGGDGGGIPPVAIAIGGALGVILLLGGIGAAVYFMVIRRSDALE